MTQYTLRVTIATPVEMLEDCNALAVCLGESSGDINTFLSATHQDSEGNTYSVASTVAKEVFLAMSEEPLVAPSYFPDVDLEAATRAQQTLTIGNEANPGSVCVIVGRRTDSAQNHVAQLGLTRIPYEEDF